MADLDSNAFLLFETPKDDTYFVHVAMWLLQHNCPFAELNIHQQRFVLACTQILKKNDGLAEFPES